MQKQTKFLILIIFSIIVLTAKQVELDDDEKIFYFDQWSDSRRKILPYNGI